MTERRHARIDCGWNQLLERTPCGELNCNSCHPQGEREPALTDEQEEAEAHADAIVTRLYRRFREWNRRGFGPEDVTWCEVKADVISLIQKLPQESKPLPSEPKEECVYCGLPINKANSQEDRPKDLAIWIHTASQMYACKIADPYAVARPNLNPIKPLPSEAQATTTSVERMTHGLNCSAWHNKQGHEVNGEDCTCGLRWRIQIETEKTMHAAWRKRAEEAELKLSQLAAKPSPELCECGATKGSYADSCRLCAQRTAKPSEPNISEDSFEAWWKWHSNNLLPSSSIIKYNAEAAWNAAKAEKVVESSVDSIEGPEEVASDEVVAIFSHFESAPNLANIAIELQAYRELKKRSDGGVK